MYEEDLMASKIIREKPRLKVKMKSKEKDSRESAWEEMKVIYSAKKELKKTNGKRPCQRKMKKKEALFTSIGCSLSLFSMTLYC